jgi:hypothetical protein
MKQHFSKLVTGVRNAAKQVDNLAVTAFLLGKKAASGFAEEAVKIFVVAGIVGVMIWVGTIVNNMLQQSGSML